MAVKWLHLHWARPAGAHGPWVLESCRCGRVRLVGVQSGVSVHWTGWHPTVRDAQREMLEWEGADTAPR